MIKLTKCVLTVALLISASVNAQSVPPNRDFSTGQKIRVAENVKRLFPLVTGAQWEYELDQLDSQMTSLGFTGGSLTKKVVGITTFKGREVFHIKSVNVNPKELLIKYPNARTHVTEGSEYWEITNEGLYLVGQTMFGRLNGIENAVGEAVIASPARVLRGVVENENAYLAENLKSQSVVNGQPFGDEATMNAITSYKSLAAYSAQSLYNAGGSNRSVTGLRLKLDNGWAASFGLSLLAPGLGQTKGDPVVVPYVGVAIGRPYGVQAPVLLQSYNIPKSGLAPTDNVTGLHWNAEESGWGINLNQQGKTIFATLFTYDASGAPMWLVASDLQQDAATGNYTGALYKTRNPVPFQPISQSNVTAVGNMNLDFWGNGFAVVTYTVNGVEVSKQIKYQKFGQNRANCSNTNALNRVAATNYQDLWWNPAESGWGVNLTHQDDTLFATVFTYPQAGGDGVWYVASGMVKQADGSFLGDLYKTTGTAFNVEPVVPLTGANVVKVGTASFKATNGENGVFTHSVDGVSVTKNVQRQVFGATQFVCAKG